MIKLIHYESGELEVQGYEKIISANRNKVSLIFNGKELNIAGNDLKLSYFSYEELAIRGNIRSVEIEEK